MGEVMEKNNAATEQNPDYPHFVLLEAFSALDIFNKAVQADVDKNYEKALALYEEADRQLWDLGKKSKPKARTKIKPIILRGRERAQMIRNALPHLSASSNAQSSPAENASGATDNAKDNAAKNDSKEDTNSTSSVGGDSERANPTVQATVVESVNSSGDCDGYNSDSTGYSCCVPFRRKSKILIKK